MNSLGIFVDSVTFDFEDFTYRTPMKFGGVVVESVTLLNVTCDIHDLGESTATGFASMPLGNAWAFPSKTLTYQQTLDAMKHLAGKLPELWTQIDAPLHPVQLGVMEERALFKMAAKVTEELALPEPIPKLAALVVGSAFDAAVHDAFGKIYDCNVYGLYAPPYLPEPMSTFLGEDFQNLYLSDFIDEKPKPFLPLYHLVGALDPLTAPANPVGDGLPEHLAEWIMADGLSHLKIKLDGQDLKWDVDRIVDVDRIATDTASNRRWNYSLDFNERCESPDYVRELLAKLGKQSPRAFHRIQYIEQPTSRDLAAHRDQRYHDISKQIPVVIDEALIDLESLMLARELGYSGCALKACKGQTQSLLMAAAAQFHDMFLCVQDLTCPGASLVHSAGLAAHIPAVKAIEANARQYVPAANTGWAKRFPGIFRPKDGVLKTRTLTGPGLGAKY